MAYIFGVDIGGTTVKMGLFTAEGELLDKWEITTRTDDGGAYILTDIAKSIEEKMAEKSIDKDDIKGIGLGVPGSVRDDGVVNKCVNLGWGVFNAADELEKLIGLPVKVGNDANMAALGEYWQGGGKGYKSIIMVTLGTGVGGGIILDGKVLSDINYTTDEKNKLANIQNGAQVNVIEQIKQDGVIRPINNKSVKIFFYFFGISQIYFGIISVAFEYVHTHIYTIITYICLPAWTCYKFESLMLFFSAK